MREIKFRAWDKKIKGFIEKFKLYNNGKKNCFGCIPGVANEDENTRYWDENIVLMQYTDLKDKNGKEVYEGDILTYEFESKEGYKRKIYEEVIWDKRMACFSFRIYGSHLDHQGKYGGGVGALMDGENLDTDGIVCGNIYENSDLIS